MKGSGMQGPRLVGSAGGRRPVPLPRARKDGQPTWLHIARAIFMGVALAFGLTLVLFLPGAITAPSVQVGAVASRTILAPSDFSIDDPTATRHARERAARTVATQYRAVPGPLALATTAASSALDAAAVLRGERRSSGRTKGGAAVVLARRSGGRLSPAAAARLLALSGGELSQTRAAVMDALAAAAKLGLNASQAHIWRLAPPFPRSGLSPQARTAATTVFAAFLQPNRVADPAATAQAREAAARRIATVQIHYRSGQAIVRVGDVIQERAVTALRQSGLLNRDTSWQTFLGDFLLALMAASILHGYLITTRSLILLRPRRLLLLDTLVLGACAAAVIIIQKHGSLPYVFPAAALGMLLTLLLDFPLALVATALWALLTAWDLNGSVLLATYYMVEGMMGALLIRGTRRSSEFFIAGGGAALAGLACLGASRLLAHGSDWLGAGADIAAVALSGVLAATLTLGSLAALGRLFGVTTTLHLLELSHPNHPLLRRLMQEAPGTYHHSMMIGTLAERAAEQIGADALLVRVIAYFHDIGKLAHPSNFAENQAAIGNIHDRIEPEESVSLILEHIYEGIRLARANHLPEVLEDGIWQHHGTNLVSFFYQQAVERRGEAAVRIEDFRYPGPKPQTREMGILMLADGVEAAVRASPGADAELIRAIIRRLTQERVRDGQLDECNLTLRDLATIENSFALVLQGISHTRVRYPRTTLPAVGNQ